jgi:alpha-tubulin suppressor-like RCC1 family protein
MTRLMRFFAAASLLAALFILSPLAHAAVPDISAGSSHSLALKFDGTVYAWGSNSFGQLGNGTTTDSAVPVLVKNLSGVVAISAGLFHNLAITADGSVWAWGLNTSGQLGNNTLVSSSLPVKVLVVSGAGTAALTGAYAIAAGGAHSLIATSTGLMAMGDNTFGQLGTGNNTSKSLATAVALPGVASMTAGRNHSAIIDTNSQVWTWGDNSTGQLGNGTTTASNIPINIALNNIIQVSSRDSTTLALRSDNVVLCWGRNDLAQCADGTVASPDMNPVVSNISNFKAVSIASGGLHSLAIAADGTILGWGDSSTGELANIPPGSYTAATGLATLAGVTKLAGGYSHTLGILNDGSILSGDVLGMGANGSGQIGANFFGPAPNTLPFFVKGVGANGLLNLTGVYNLAVNVAGGGSVSSSPVGIACSAGTCVGNFTSGTVVTLTATANSGNGFQGWGGACSGVGTCTLTIAGPQSVTASFSGTGGSGGVTGTVPDTGYWWNPNEPGRGYMIEQSNGKVLFASFLYEFNGRATWYSSGPSPFGGGTYAGVLNLYAGGQTLTSAYHPATQVGGNFGTISISFSSPTSGIMTWPGGSIPLRRYDFVTNGSTTPQSSTNPQTGYWWNPSEPGRGFSLEVQNGTLLFAGYMYDTDGNPIWYSSQGTLSTAGLYLGTWAQYGFGQTLTGTFKASSVVNANVGALTIQFTSTTSGTMYLPDGRQITIQRFFF